MLLTPETVFRRYVTAGVPDSGAHDPLKSEIIQLLNLLFGVSRGGWVVASTVAELNAITPENTADGGVVLTGTGAGYYDRDGSAWVFGRGFPDTFAKVALSGSGTAQTGVVNAGVNPASIEVFFAKVATPNAGPLTLSISGGPARSVRNLAGNVLSAGEWTGMVMFYLNEDGEYQLLIDAGAAASAATSASAANADADRAEGEADRAEVAADAAQAAGANEFAATRSALRSLDTTAVTHVYLTEPGREGQFIWRNGDYSALIAADTQEGMYLKADAVAASAGAWVRQRERIDHVIAIWFGAVPDSTGVGVGTNSATAIQGALDLAIALGCNLNLGWGNYRLSSGLVYNKTALNADSGKVPSIYGSGITTSRLYFDTAVTVGLDIQGAFTGGIYGSFFRIEDFGIFSSGKTGTGVKVKDVALADFARIRSNGWDKGLHFQNVISVKFDHPYIDGNVYGIHAEDGPSAAPCNAINIVSPWIGSNDRVGILADNPATLNISGGSIEGNGLVTGGIDPNGSGGLIVTSPGKGGHNSVVVQGVYFEHNKGAADILIYSILHATSHYIHGNSFARISATDFTTQNILIIADTVAQTLSLSGNGFGNLSSAYTESGARPYVKIDDANNVLTVVDDGSNLYENAIASPDFSPVYASTLKTGAQAVGWASAAGVLSAGSSNVASVSKVATGRYKIDLRKGWVGPKFATTMPNLGRTCALFTYDDTSLTIEFSTLGAAPAAADVDFGFAVYKPV